MSASNEQAGGAAARQARTTAAAHRRAAGVPLRAALIGCGAVAERLHLPALLSAPTVRVSALVDPDPGRLAALAARLGPDVHTARTIAGLERDADFAIVAVPNDLHAPLALQLLERGLHVLVEKPMAVSLEEGQRLVRAAERSGRKLGVALLRRHYPSFAFAQQALRAGWLGRIESFDLREGVVNTWPATTPSLLERERGGGVLLDAGAHALDWLLTLLGPFARVSYADDARGGVEANCVLELELRSGARGVVELSRNRALRNTCIIRGERGEIEVSVYPDNAVVLRAPGGEVVGIATDGRAHGGDVAGAARRQLDGFVRSVVTDSEPPVPARSALESARLFDACRGARRPLALPWEPFAADVDWAAFAGKRVLVVGGAGFIGGRVVEALAQNSAARVRVLARTYTGAANIARYPVEIVRGDVGDPETLDRALQGCDYVVNCSYGKGDPREQRRVNVEAVGNLVRLAARHGVRQLVHTSTLMVYGAAADGVLDEQARSRPAKRDHYGYTKWKGEQAALGEGRRRGVAVAVLQPAAVYGPGAPSWTLNPIRNMKSARLVLVDGGAGISNAVYVDDVVAALLRAALEPRAAGERMLVSGAETITWREFLGAYDDLLGGGRLVAMDAGALTEGRRLRRRRQGNLAQLRALLREETQARRRLLALPALAAVRRAVEAVLPAGVVGRLRERVRGSGAAAPGPDTTSDGVRLPAPAEEAFLRAAVRVDCRKAAALIGYAPRYSLREGMDRVAAWARWAGLV